MFYFCVNKVSGGWEVKNEVMLQCEALLKTKPVVFNRGAASP